MEQELPSASFYVKASCQQLNFKPNQNSYGEIMNPHTRERRFGILITSGKQT